MNLTTTLRYLTLVLLISVLTFPGWVAKSISMALKTQVAGWLIQIAAAWILVFMTVLWRHHHNVKNRRIFFDHETVKNRINFDEKRSKNTLFLLKYICCILLILWLLMSPENATGEVRMVSVAKNNVNLRHRPGIGSKVTWQLNKGFPLIVLQLRDNWYKVRDFEGDTGWIYRPLTTRTPHVIVKKKVINIRSRPGTSHPIVAKAYKGVVFKTIASVKGWVKIRHKKGVVGWVARDLVWGW